jgi:hypothetical protein
MATETAIYGRGKRIFDARTGLWLTPGQLKVITLLRENATVTTDLFLRSDAGSRFGGRICELRHGPDKEQPDQKFKIDEKPLGGGVAGSGYKLLAEPRPVSSSTREVERVVSHPPQADNDAAASADDSLSLTEPCGVEGVAGCPPSVMPTSQPLPQSLTVDSLAADVGEQCSLFDHRPVPSMYGDLS